MVMDMLTILSFAVLILYKVVVAISSMFGGRIQKASNKPRRKDSHNKQILSPAKSAGCVVNPLGGFPR